VNSKALSEEVAKIVVEAQARITGIGAEQYARGDTQQFEHMTIGNLLEYMQEELLDQINYSVMNLLRLRWLQDAIGVIIHESVSPGNAEHLARRRAAISEALYGKSKAEMAGSPPPPK
jgi:hypothetical protein